MGMKHQRLDGSVSSLEKQKRIDQFNAPESDLFAFLLSTRAGGVGINLATADTVIVMDPDFNPHQDIQAISRAHRIGQNKKVLCFQLMTRASAEEKIMQIGRKKMALDHVVVEQLDAEDLEDRDLESVLRHGAAELFNDESNADQDIKYDIASVEKLLDRSQIENTKQSEDKSAESQFSFARVWANDQGALEENMHVPDDEPPPDPGMWDKILREREQRAAAEAAAREQTFGRGRRTKLVSTSCFTNVVPLLTKMARLLIISSMPTARKESSHHLSSRNSVAERVAIVILTSRRMTVMKRPLARRKCLQMVPTICCRLGTRRLPRLVSISTSFLSLQANILKPNTSLSSAQLFQRPGCPHLHQPTFLQTIHAIPRFRSKSALPVVTTTPKDPVP